MNKRMNIFGDFRTFVFFFCLFLIAPGLASAERISEKKPVFELTARVMLLDLMQDKAIIAEREIALKSHIEKGQKVWDTSFLDRQGNQISPSLFRSRDRVRVTGMETKEGIVAEEIRLMD